MEVKGSSLFSTRDFVMRKFGRTGLDQLLNALPSEARKKYTYHIHKLVSY